MMREYEIHTKWYRKKIMRKFCQTFSFKDKSGMSITYDEHKDGFNSIFNIKIQGPAAYTKVAGFACDFEENNNGEETNRA